MFLQEPEHKILDIKELLGDVFVKEGNKKLIALKDRLSLLEHVVEQLRGSGSGEIIQFNPEGVVQVVQEPELPNQKNNERIYDINHYNVLQQKYIELQTSKFEEGPLQQPKKISWKWFGKSAEPKNPLLRNII